MKPKAPKKPAAKPAVKPMGMGTGMGRSANLGKYLHPKKGGK